MRIKSSENGGPPQAYLARDPKDPLPNPHEDTRCLNGHMKETALISGGQGKKLDSRGGIPEQNNNVETHFVNGQNHVIYPTAIRNDHEMAVRTKVISVKRNIQPSNNDYRSKPMTQTNPPNGTVGQKPKTPMTNGQTTPKIETQQKFQFNYSDIPPPSPRTPNGVAPTTPYLISPTTPSSVTPSTPSAVPATPNALTSPTPYTPTTPRSFDSFDGPFTRHSSTSSNTLPYPVSPALQSPNYFNASPTRLTRQMSSYERTFSGSDLDHLSAELAQTNVSAAPKFIKDTSAFWYKPDITREQALAILRERSPGSFVVRDSRCFPGAFGLALKVDRLPAAVQSKPGADMSNEYVRHFLIEMSSKGVKLKGCPNEPVFGSLSALVYQHSITPLALPCKLIIPTEDQEVPPEEAQNGQNDAVAAAELLKQGAACNVMYIGSLDTESLTGPMAIENAITKKYEEAKANPNKTSIVHFKVSPQGITLTDIRRKLFFRRHYPTSSVTFCGLDPQGGSNNKQPARRWDATATKGGPDAWMFGFVARKMSGSNDNECHIFAELETTQPARAIVNFVTRILIGSQRQNNSP